MKQRSDTDELREEYTLKDFSGGLECGKYAARMVEGSNIARLNPDIARAFPDSPSVNEALRSLLRRGACFCPNKALQRTLVNSRY